MGMRTDGLIRGRHSGGTTAGDRSADAPQARRSFRFRGSSDALLSSALGTSAPLPPLPTAPVAGPTTGAPRLPEAPSWSPLTVARPLFALVWACFGLLGATVDALPAPEVAGLGHLLAICAGVVALVFLTLSVAHAQVSGLRPRPAVIAVVVLGLGQGAVAAAFPGGDRVDLWGVAACVFVLVGVAVPLAWVSGQFHSGVRRQRIENHASLTATWIERARRQASQTVQSVHRHDVRSMLFLVDGAARTLVDGTLTAEQRSSFGEMLAEGVERLGALMDVRSEEIQPFPVDGVARAVVHAERKTGREVTADLPAGLNALGRAADAAAVLRTVVAVTARKSSTGVQVRGELHDGAIVIRVEPSDPEGPAEPLPLLTGTWEAVSADSFKSSRQNDEETVDLYVAARLLAEQGADLWSVPQRARFVVRLPAAPESTAREGA